MWEKLCEENELCKMYVGGGDCVNNMKIKESCKKKLRNITYEEKCQFHVKNKKIKTIKSEIGVR